MRGAGGRAGVAVGQVAGKGDDAVDGVGADGDALGDPGASCADCGAGDHLGMAMACVLALLLVLLVLLPPRLLPGWMRTVPRPLLVWRGIDRQVSRAPLLHVLCISRT